MLSQAFYLGEEMSILTTGLSYICVCQNLHRKTGDDEWRLAPFDPGFSNLLPDSSPVTA
uniref:Uncharacterized protein n=1 Tax=Anguilla anguilla TaxID=7936 RepID=A0A0E9TU15_ANGAN